MAWGTVRHAPVSIADLPVEESATVTRWAHETLDVAAAHDSDMMVR